MTASTQGATRRVTSSTGATARWERFGAWLDAHPRLVFALLYLVALGLRLLYLGDFRHSLLAQIPLMDEAYYKAEAWRLVRGAPPASDAFFMTPLYPAFLSLVFRLVGDGPTGPAAVQLGLGAFAAPLTWVCGRRALLPGGAALAGLAVASFAPLVFFESLYLVEGLVLLCLMAAFSLALAAPASARGAALCGVALGLAILGRGSNLLLAATFGLWFWIEGRRHGGRWRRTLGAFGLGMLVTVGPLVVRNAVRAGRPLLLTANAGFNLYVGNGPLATGIFVRVPGVDFQQDPLTVRYVQRALHRPVTASETSDFWMARTREWVREHPGHTLQLFAWKLVLFWNRMSIPQVEGFETAAPGSVLARPPFWHSFAFLPLALIGIAAAALPFLRRGRDSSRPSISQRQRAAGLLATSALVYSISIALFFVTDRYRVPILPVLMLLAVGGVGTIAAAFAPQRRRVLPLLLVVLAIGFFVTAPARLGVDQRRLRRDLHVHTALRYAQAQHFDAAVTEYRAALLLDPTDPDVRDGWARMLGRAGQDSSALEAFRSLLHDHPDDARAWYNFGNLYRRLGRAEPARSAYERSLAIEPNRETAWNHLGEVYRSMGDTARAAVCYRRALAVVPAHEPALNNLAALRAQQGHAAEAEAGWRAALAANPRHLPSLVNLAILLTDSGRTEEALPLWRRAWSIDPDNKLVRRALETLDPQALQSVPRRGRTPNQTGDDD